jgi:hypothetical protein
MERYISECGHTFNICEIERNYTPYKGKHYKRVQYKIVLAFTVTREKENGEIEATMEKLLCLCYINMK